MPMPSAMINCDVPIRGSVKALFDAVAGIEPLLLYKNGSIPSEFVLVVKGSDKAFVGPTIQSVIEKADYEIYGGL